jgi:hypothetical protein
MSIGVVELRGTKRLLTGRRKGGLTALYKQRIFTRSYTGSRGSIEISYGHTNTEKDRS